MEMKLDIIRNMYGQTRLPLMVEEQLIDTIMTNLSSLLDLLGDYKKDTVHHYFSKNGNHVFKIDIDDSEITKFLRLYRQIVLYYTPLHYTNKPYSPLLRLLTKNKATSIDFFIYDSTGKKLYRFGFNRMIIENNDYSTAVVNRWRGGLLDLSKTKKEL